MTAEQLVCKMHDEKGITFDIMSESEAIKYLKEKNNYFRLASYRKNYVKDINNEKYLNLDFAYLVELSTLDMYLREILFKMTVDIEHDVKIKLLNDITDNPDEDGYKVVSDYLSGSGSYLFNRFKSQLKASYIGNLIDKYFSFSSDAFICNCPIWAFLEIITFGDFIKFSKWYISSYLNIKMSNKDKEYISELNAVRSLRNACAHNNCLILDLMPTDNNAPSRTISQFSAAYIKSKDRRDRWLSVRVILEFATVLKVHSEMVSLSVKKHNLEEIQEIFNVRMKRNESFFLKNELIKSAYLFAKEIVDKM